MPEMVMIFGAAPTQRSLQNPGQLGRRRRSAFTVETDLLCTQPRNQWCAGQPTAHTRTSHTVTTPQPPPIPPVTVTSHHPPNPSTIFAFALHPKTRHPATCANTADPCPTCGRVGRAVGCKAKQKIVNGYGVSGAAQTHDERTGTPTSVVTVRDVCLCAVA